VSFSKRQYRLNESLLPNDGMLPLLDILFSTIGILIVIMVVRSPNNERAGIAYAVDGLLTCADGKQWVFYNDASSSGSSFSTDQMDALFVELGSYPRMDLLVAFGAACFNMKDAFSEAFEAARAITEKNADKSLKLARVAFVPLADSPSAVQELLDRWLEAPPGMRP